MGVVLQATAGSVHRVFTSRASVLSIVPAETRDGSKPDETPDLSSNSAANIANQIQPMCTRSNDRQQGCIPKGQEYWGYSKSADRTARLLSRHQLHLRLMKRFCEMDSDAQQNNGGTKRQLVGIESKKC